MKKFFDWLGDHWLIIFPRVVLTVALFLQFWMDGFTRHDRMISECVADGFKEYECEAMPK